MQITVKFEPQINDMVMIALLVDQLTNLAMKVDPMTAKTVRKEVGYRLKRLKAVKPTD